MLHMAFAQMARFYNVPCGGYIGLTNSKINDAQSGYETGMSTVAGTLAGADMLNMAGLLDALKSFDFAKAVVDNEIALMLKRVVRGLEFSEENMALDIIAKVGPGGNFMLEDTTVRWMKTAGLLTRIADRDPRTVWEARGALDSHARGLQRARQIFSRPNPAVFSTELDDRIRVVFPGLVSGDAVLPEGW
jgi:trimethylamine---corrinoid protein Co-methyltransferase